MEMQKKIEAEKQEENRTETACFMNMCMIQDAEGRILALDKVDDHYTGTTFPGGHVERGEIFVKSVIREVKEETGLDIQNPHLCGVYHWYKGEIHNVVFLYKADRYTGELRSSEEGNVYWVSKKEFKKKQLAPGMEEVLHIMDSEQISECYEQLEDGGYVGALY